MLYNFDIRLYDGTTIEETVELRSDTPLLLGTLVQKYPNEVKRVLELFSSPFPGRIITKKSPDKFPVSEEVYFRVDFFKKIPGRCAPEIKVDSDKDFVLKNINTCISDVDDEDEYVYLILCEIDID